MEKSLTEIFAEMEKQKDLFFECIDTICKDYKDKHLTKSN